MIPARIALEAYKAVRTSVIAKPILKGCVLLPVKCINPVSAWIILSKAGKSALLPKSPYPDTEQYTSLGLYLVKVSQSIFSFCVTPGTKFSSTISAFSTSRYNTYRQAGYLKFKATLFLLQFTDSKQVEVLLFQGGPHRRVGSPSGDQILIIQQPKPDRTEEAQGPTMMRDRSRIRLFWIRLGILFLFRGQNYDIRNFQDQLTIQISKVQNTKTIPNYKPEQKQLYTFLNHSSLHLLKKSLCSFSIMLSPQPQIKSQNYQRNKLLTIVGSLLIQFSAGLIPVWGNANLYFLSYFKNNGEKVDKDSNSWILLATVVPMCIFIVFATKLSNFLGYTRMIKLCSVIYFLSYLVIYIKFNMVTCTIFLLIIPITVNTMSFVPMYNCLWSYYMQTKNMVTGYVLVSYGISGVLFNILFLHLVNPQNREAKLNDHGFVYFGEEVSGNLLYAAKVIYFTVAVIFLVGAWMIRREDQEIEKQGGNNAEEKRLENKHYELKEQQQDQKYQQHNRNNHQPISNPYPQLKPSTDDSPSSILPSSCTFTNPQTFSLRQYLFSQKFIIIFFTVLLIDFYATYLVSNFKLIFIDTINDDHFLGYCLIANTITALVGTFVWGWLGDKVGFAKSMVWVVVIDLVFKLIGIFSKSKPALFTLMLLLGFTSRGMSTLSGPGLVEVFGLKIATQLLPIKALAVIGPMVCVPILQLIFLNFLTPFQFMNCLIVISFFLLALSIYFVKNYGQQKEKMQKNQMQQMKEIN